MLAALSRVRNSTSGSASMRSNRAPRLSCLGGTVNRTHTHTAGNRIVIAYGRDATDVAFVTQFGALTLDSLKVVVEQVA